MAACESGLPAILESLREHGYAIARLEDAHSGAGVLRAAIGVIGEKLQTVHANGIASGVTGPVDAPEAQLAAFRERSQLRRELLR